MADEATHAIDGLSSLEMAHAIDLETGAAVEATFVTEQESEATLTEPLIQYPVSAALDRTFDASVVAAVWRFETNEIAGLIAAESIVEIHEPATLVEATIETDGSVGAIETDEPTEAVVGPDWPAEAVAEAMVDTNEPADSIVAALSEFDQYVLSVAAPVVWDEPLVADDAPDRNSPASTAKPSVAKSPKRQARQASIHAPVTPYCPYCALLLDPPPETSRRCPRCRERIAVKHLDGRAIYLTQAAVAIFDSERRRTANAPRWKRERQRWLKVAAATNADAGRIARLDSMPISEESVTAARNLYAATVLASFRAAKRDRRWEEASRMMREHAQVLFRYAGSPIPPPDDIVQPHRDGAAAMLRGISEMSREAELVSGRCCDVCATDDGKTFRIALELRTPRLPHAGCPRGLCRCEWYLAVRDQVLVRRQLRRRARADVASSSTGS